MTIRSLSFDDNDEEELYVFSGYDLMISHYDIADLDWREVAERSSIDERRGLVIAQVAAIEDLIDEFLMYLDDPVDAESYQRGLDTQTIGPRLDQLSRNASTCESVRQTGGGTAQRPPSDCPPTKPIGARNHLLPTRADDPDQRTWPAAA